MSNDYHNRKMCQECGHYKTCIVVEYWVYEDAFFMALGNDAERLNECVLMAECCKGYYCPTLME